MKRKVLSGFSLMKESEAEQRAGRVKTGRLFQTEPGAVEPAEGKGASLSKIRTGMKQDSRSSRVEPRAVARPCLERVFFYFLVKIYFG